MEDKVNGGRQKIIHRIKQINETDGLEYVNHKLPFQDDHASLNKTKQIQGQPQNSVITE